MMTKKKDKYDLMEQRSLSRCMGSIFERAEERYPLIDFAKVFLGTSLFKEFFVDYTIFSQSRNYVLQLFSEELQQSNKSISTVSGTQFDGDVAYWFGYMFAEWYQSYNFDVSILTKDNIEWLYYNYDVLHTQSVKYVYEELVSEVLCRE